MSRHVVAYRSFYDKRLSALIIYHKPIDKGDTPVTPTRIKLGFELELLFIYGLKVWNIYASLNLSLD
jgi:hypothetical protein